jgi:hypothetical protein
MLSQKKLHWPTTWRFWSGVRSLGSMEAMAFVRLCNEVDQRIQNSSLVEIYVLWWSWSALESSSEASLLLFEGVRWLKVRHSGSFRCDPGCYCTISQPRYAEIWDTHSWSNEIAQYITILL